MATKDQILSLLLSCRGSYLSGEELALAIGISRAAVWKSVKALREAGFPIDAQPNRGYRLETGLDILSASGIQGLLNPGLPLKIQLLPTVTSTNALLREGRAKAVCKPGDLFGVLGLRGAAAPAAVRSAPDPMSETERRVLACIGPKAKGVEELGTASGLPTGLLLGTLMKLELAGRVTCLPGKRYILR